MKLNNQEKIFLTDIISTALNDLALHDDDDLGTATKLAGDIVSKMEADDDI